MADERARINYYGKYYKPFNQRDEWVELENPVRYGYVKRFRLRDDIANRKDAHVFQEILRHIGDSVHSRRKDFRYKPYKRKRWEVAEPELQIWPHNKAWPMPEHYKKWFIYGRHVVKDSFGGYSGSSSSGYTIIGWKFAYEYFFVTYVEPYFATHMRIHDSQLESRKSEIDNKIDHLGGYHVLHKALHDCNPGKSDGWESGHPKNREFTDPRLEDALVEYEEIFCEDEFEDNVIEEILVEFARRRA